MIREYIITSNKQLRELSRKNAKDVKKFLNENAFEINDPDYINDNKNTLHESLTYLTMPDTFGIEEITFNEDVDTDFFVPTLDMKHKAYPEDMEKENDEFIDNNILNLRKYEDNLSEEAQEALEGVRRVNANLVNAITGEISELVRRSLATILEYNTITTFQAIDALSNKINEDKIIKEDNEE